MGFKMTWVGCRHKGLDTVLADLRLRRTGEREEFPENEYACLTLPHDWTIVVNNLAIGEHILDYSLDALRRNAEVLVCYLNENTMMSSANLNVDGKETWSVLHDSEVAIDHLEIRGMPPRQFLSIQKNHLDQQRLCETDDVDYIFNVPIKLAGSITGFQHDAVEVKPGEKPFETLERIPRFSLFGRKR